MYEFDPTEDLIRVWAKVRLDGESIQMLIAVDTGASQTILDRSMLSALSFERPLANPLSIVTAGGIIDGFPLALDQFSTLDHDLANYTILVCDLPPGLGVDGLLGLDFFRGKKLVVDFENGYIGTEERDFH